jgi:spermidine synthase
VKPWETLDRADSDGVPLVLARRGDEFSIRVNGSELMTSRTSGSERELARRSLDAIGGAAPRVLVGGLGMGFTLRAGLDVSGPRARFDVVELSPAVVRWNRTWFASLAGAPLEDARVTLIEGDVGTVIARRRRAYDAILLDVDNGPTSLSVAGNASLYGKAGLRAAAAALDTGGVLAVWSASDDRAFEKALRDEGFDVRVARPFAHGDRGRRHVVFLAFRGEPATRTKPPRARR